MYIGSSGLVGRVLEVTSITCQCSVVLKILHHFVCFPFVPDGVFTNRLGHVEYEGTGKSNGCNDSLQQCLLIAYRGDSRDFPIKRLRGMIDMFETPPEGPTVVATHYGPSHCLVMFASETPAANKYPNRL